MLISGIDMFNENTMNINILPFCGLMYGENCWKQKVPKQFVIERLKETQKETSRRYPK